MTQNPKTFTLTDPRTFDGDPFEVAQRGVAQLSATVSLVIEALDPAKLMARSAELERQCIRDEPLDAVGWPDTAEGRRWLQVEQDLAQVAKNLRLLEKVAAFNPKKAR